jgi:hypothetical protein
MWEQPVAETAVLVALAAMAAGLIVAQVSEEMHPAQEPRQKPRSWLKNL